MSWQGPLLRTEAGVEESARAEFFPLRSTRGVLAEFARIVLPVLDLLAIPLAFGLRTVLPAGEAPRREALKFGSRGRIRTYDQSVNSRPLYH